MFTLPSGCWSHHRQQHWPGAVRDVGGQQSHRNLCVMTTEPRGVEPMTCGHYRQHLQEADVQSALPASGEDQAEPPHSSASVSRPAAGEGGMKCTCVETAPPNQPSQDKEHLRHPRHVPFASFPASGHTPWGRPALTSVTEVPVSCS